MDSFGTVLADVAWVNVTAHCTVPDVTIDNTEFFMNDCYTYFPYPVEFYVRNNTELSTCYCIVPQVIVLNNFKTLQV